MKEIIYEGFKYNITELNNEITLRGFASENNLRDGLSALMDNTIHLPPCDIIADNAFMAMDPAQTIEMAELIEKVNFVLPDNIKKIGENAFKYCKGFTEMSFPSSLETIGFHAFSETNLEYVCVPKTLKNLAPGAFYGCTNLKTVSFLSDYIKMIPGYCFAKCTNLDTITVSRIIEEIGNNAFERTGFKSFDLKYCESVKELGPEAFANCKNLEKVSFSDNFKSIGSSCFIDCESLKEVNLNDGLVSIGSRAFKNTGIEEIIIPSSVKGMGDGVFKKCKELKKAVVNAQIKLLPDYTFFGDFNLSELVLNKGIEELGIKSLANTGFISFTVPKHIKKLDCLALAWCEELRKLIIENPHIILCERAIYNEDLESLIFDDNFNDAPIRKEYADIFKDEIFKSKTDLVEDLTKNKITFREFNREFGSK